ncbi:hypothetical protein EX30DRAFT_338047 [Ascodesmis nigricans]|uniref:Nucleotide exchange factor SIL1 n=1 Tax=Ascodesmis nigricans TaxID=341454 RepID=A0A4S2N8P7_9PEZI|nr:hypothetical protein EX30DRAFT_338047 [Ascodesmis nigricans]
MLPKTLLLFALPVLRSLAEPISVQDPAEANSELICHPGFECYPKVFMPTTEFQTVHDDQELPKGLHYRLNMETGLKEAKIWDRSVEEEENAVVVVDPDSSATVSSDSSGDAAGISVHGTNEGDQTTLDAGAIKPPRDALPGDTKAFFEYTAVISEGSKASDSQLIAALSGLEDMAHEIYWGSQIAGSHFRRLLDLATKHDDSAVRASAALVLGSACSNNPKAISKGREDVGDEKIVGGLMDALEQEKDAKTTQRQVFALSQMVKNESLQKILQQIQGLSRLVSVLESSEDPATKGKVAVLIEDAFLQNYVADKVNEEVQGRLCEVLQDELVRPESSKDVTEKVFSTFVNLTGNDSQCEANMASLGWMNMIARTANGRTVEQIEDDGESLLALVMMHRNRFLRDLDDL